MNTQAEAVSSIIDLLALIAQTETTLATYKQVVGTAQAEGRAHLTDAEKAQINSMLVASEDQLEAATQ